MTTGPAMTRDEALRAIAVGLDVVGELAPTGLDLIGIGEMGIGNTTAASAIDGGADRRPPARSPAAGPASTTRRTARKVDVIERALARNRPDPTRPDRRAGRRRRARDRASLVGVIVGAAAARIPVVLDGFITGAAALVAAALAPAVAPRLIAAHRSVEPGHAVVLDHLGLAPLLELDLRLGEGTGAALAIGLIDAAVPSGTGWRRSTRRRCQGRRASASRGGPRGRARPRPARPDGVVGPALLRAERPAARPRPGSRKRRTWPPSSRRPSTPDTRIVSSPLLRAHRDGGGDRARGWAAGTIEIDRAGRRPISAIAEGRTFESSSGRAGPRRAPRRRRDRRSTGRAARGAASPRVAAAWRELVRAGRRRRRRLARRAAPDRDGARDGRAGIVGPKLPRSGRPWEPA